VFLDAKLNRSKLKIKKVDTPFLHSVHAHKVLTKMKAVTPNEEGLPSINGERYVYPAWPDTLNESLFLTPRPIPKMISAEFDRQAILVSRLRAHGGGHDAFVEFNSAEYDPSPEVAVFTVFFFVYSSLAGLQWQEYKNKMQEAENKKKDRRTGNVETRNGIRGDEQRELPCRGEYEEREEGESSSIFCAGDFTMCGACSEFSLESLKSTLLFCGAGADDVYTTLIRETADTFMEIQRQLSSGFAESQSQDFVTVENATEEFEEAREMAMAQLDLAFESLSTLELRDLSADLDAYKSLMEACGRCGDPQRALKLMERMKKDGFAADSEMLNFFVASFAHEDGSGIGAGEDSAISDMPTPVERYGNDMYYAPLRREHLSRLKGEEDGPESCVVANKAGYAPECLDETRSLSTIASRESSKTGDSVTGSWFGSYDYRSIGNRMKRPRKRKFKAKKVDALLGRPTTPRLSTQFDLGEALLTLLYPDLKIDSSSETCPHCSVSHSLIVLLLLLHVTYFRGGTLIAFFMFLLQHVLSENDVVSGWAPCSFQEYKTHCPKCHHGFVPHFAVSCSSSTFQGSQGPRSALFCEFLSPWVVRRELQHVIKGDTGIEGMLDPQWRNGTDIRATLFWNLIVLFRHYHLPFGFLLQGSIKGRLILPRTPDDMM
jgi:pentatricopeptide repeat protein